MDPVYFEGDGSAKKCSVEGTDDCEAVTQEVNPDPKKTTGAEGEFPPTSWELSEGLLTHL